MSNYIQKECRTEGCNKMGRYKGLRFGKRYYGPYCPACHRHGCSKQCILNYQCQLCGWKKGPCDRHKVVPELGYQKSNIIILCPNCHRLETLGLLGEDISHLVGKAFVVV